MSGGLRIPDDTIAMQTLASDPGLSAWVSANAGSGKTHVLAQRVIRLLLQGTEPSRILCLTYTRAAASNMATRVFGTLGGWTRLDDDALAQEIARLGGDEPTAASMRNARRLFAQALETPGGLKIQTIHAFCEAVLHQFPLEANIAGHFEMLDPQMEVALLAEARREMIAGTSDPEQPGLADAFATVLRHGGEAGLERLLGEVVSRRDAVARFAVEIGTGPSGRAALLAEFGLQPEETPETILAAIWPDTYFTKELAGQLAARAQAAGKSQAEEFAGRLSEVFALAEASSILPGLCNAFLTRKNGTWEPRSPRNIASKGVGEHFPGLPEEFTRLCEGVVAVADRLALLRMLETTHAALAVADRLIAIYERLKSARGCLDFNDLIVRTVNLLARRDASAWVQYKLDKGIDHILLDEAQDTSPDQWAVIKTLANDFFAGKSAREEAQRTIFAVGDEKQSIYSFQGADPEAFSLSGHAFANVVKGAGHRFERVRLLHSFRSVEDVLSAVDLTFAREDVRKGLTRDPEPLDHKAIRQAAPGYVELWPSLSPRTVEEPEDWTEPIDHASAPAVRLAAMIADTIADWITKNDQIEGKGRALAPGDILVLVRKRDRFVHALSRELKNRKVPVAGADRLALADHIAVQDLIAIGRVVIQPDDDLSLACLLKSPVFGFSEDDLYELAAGRRAEESLLDRLSAHSSVRAAWQPVAETLRRWRREAGYVSPFAFYARILGRDGIRAKMIARLGVEAGDVVDEFLNFSLASERAGIVGLEALLGLLETGGPEIKREMDQSRGEVRIMTAHAAKGLEAPVVFLVDSGSAPFHDSHLPRLIPFIPRSDGWRGPGFLWRAGSDTTNSVSKSIAVETRAKAEEEYRRLLYVGMTRAEDRLILCGYQGKRAPSDMTWHSIVCQALLSSPECREVTHPTSGETIHRYRITNASPVAADTPAAPPFHTTPMPPQLLEPLAPSPVLPRPLVPSGVGLAVEDPVETVALPGSPVLDTPAADSFALQRGVAVHRLLQRLPDIAIESRHAMALAYLERICRDMSPDARAAIWKEVEPVLEDDRFAPLFGAGSRAEVSVMGTVMLGDTERAISGKIDRLAVTGDKVILVDYKTNRPAPAFLTQVPGSHIAQIALYRELLKPVYPGRVVQAALVYTATPVLIEVPREAMDDALAALARA